MASRKRVGRSGSQADPLAEYARKRDFRRTGEPAPDRRAVASQASRNAPSAAAADQWRFVVQKHAARRLHYDLRLELGGTLKSWALTRGPSLIAGERRLAVRTEDHPMQYLDFEGNIPKGEYGGGAMIVWDRGRWSCAFDPRYGLDKGHLDITLAGSRLKGRWHLIRMRSRRGEKRENWLLIKADDEFARPAGEPDITDEATRSHLSGRTTEELAALGQLRPDHADRASVIEARRRALPDPGEVRGARKGILPAFLEPSLPQTSAKAPSGPKWVHEIKYDGYRIQARIEGRNISLLTRKGLDWTSRFATIAVALKSLGLSSALLDGEIVVEDGSGIPSFSLLQQDLKAGRGERFRYLLFDLLYCEGFDLTKAALGDRKALLQRIVMALPATSVIRFSEHLQQDGPTMFEHACRLGLEGIVSKRIDLPYCPGRGEHWLKTKGVLRQEFVILGYIPSTAAKGCVGALLLGYYDGTKLHYAGRVGTGYSAEQAKALRVELDAITAARPALANLLPAGSERDVRWAAPKLVCEVEYRGRTADKLIRQSAFIGLREDRPPEEIGFEAAPATGSRTGLHGRRATPTQSQLETSRKSDHRCSRVRLTHPERLLWPQPGISKQGLADFYTEIADWILPHISGRVLSLVRCPSGVSEKCFF
ncbi:MAG TPA: DNA ligase D, partial [Xanthobacteraceae bacterium]